MTLLMKSSEGQGGVIVRLGHTCRARTRMQDGLEEQASVGLHQTTAYKQPIFKMAKDERDIQNKIPKVKGNIMVTHHGSAIISSQARSPKCARLPNWFFK